MADTSPYLKLDSVIDYYTLGGLQIIYLVIDVGLLAAVIPPLLIHIRTISNDGKGRASRAR
jgi:hypothetical protein